VGEHPGLYSKAGHHSITGEQLYICKSCRKRLLDSDPVRIHHKTRHLASDLFSRVANKSPVRGAVRGMALKSPDSYYSILDFISRRCNALSGKFDRRMIDGEVLLPKTLKLSVDVHKDADSFLINKEAALNGDTLKPEAFRQRAQYWLSSDEVLGGRKLGQKLGFNNSQDVLQQITDIYSAAQSRKDIEDREDQKMNLEYCNPILTEGMQVHVPYTCYAHFQLIHMLVNGAGVEKLFYYMDCDSMLRAGFMSAFEQEIRSGDAHAFYVRYSKYLTTPKKADLYEKAKESLSDYRGNLPANKKNQAALWLMYDHIKAAAHIGKWKDKWVTHPMPSMNEPDKAICWLTENTNNQYDDITMAQMYMDAGINAVDNIFQISRRLVNAFERPIGTSSGYNTVWHGYAPYHPKMVEQYLSLLRVYHNFIKVGKDKKTPAMRLGLTTQTLDFDDVLWPGESIPRAPRKRRKGLCL